MPGNIRQLKKKLNHQIAHQRACSLAIIDTRKRINALEEVIRTKRFRGIEGKRIAEKVLAAQRNIIKILHANNVSFSNNIQHLQQEIDKL